MKDAARSKKPFYDTVCSALIDNHPKMFGIFLALAFIFLAGSAAFLISDILSFKPDTSHKISLSNFQLNIPKEITTAIKNWQAKGLKLFDQGKDIALSRSPQNITRSSQKISTGDKAIALRAKNSTLKAKNTPAKSKLPSLLPMSVNSSKSSRNKTPTLPSKSYIAAITSSTESGSGSDSSGESEPLQSDDYYYDVDEAPLNSSSENGSQINQSIVNNKSIDSTTENLLISNIAVGSNYSSYYLFSADITNVSLNNSSAVSIDSETLEIDMNSLNSSNVSNRTTKERSDSINLEAADLNLTRIGNVNISSDISDNSFDIFDNSSNISNSSSNSIIFLENPKANFADSGSIESYDNITIDDNDSFKKSAQELDLPTNKTSNSQLQIEESQSTLSLLDQREGLVSRVSMIDNASSSPIDDNISDTNSSSIESEILSNNANDKDNLSIKNIENPDFGNNISESAIGSSQNSEQNSEQRQSQSNARIKSPLGSIRKSNMPLMQKFNKNTGEIQDTVENASAGSEDEAAHSQSESASRFKKLKIQTPSWMAKA